jgi:hypothetical protein
MFGRNRDGHMHGVEGQVQDSSQCGDGVVNGGSRRKCLANEAFP